MGTGCLQEDALPVQGQHREAPSLQQLEVQEQVLQLCIRCCWQRGRAVRAGIAAVLFLLFQPVVLVPAPVLQGSNTRTFPSAAPS